VHLPCLAVEHVGAPAGKRAPALEQQIDGQVVLSDDDARLGARRLAERANDLAPGRVERVQDAPFGVAALQPEVVLAIFGIAAQVEVRAERDQVAHAIRALAHDHFHHVPVAEPVSRDECVGDVRLEAVFRAPHRGDTTLRVAAGALGQAVLGDEDDAACAGALQSAGEARDAAAQDQELALDGHGQASRGRSAGSSA
jgi:hypothetical protein